MVDRPDLTEMQLGEFRMLRLLGAGGMADVYLAEQTSLQRHVAVKIMRPDAVRGSDEIMLARFKQEAMSAANLNHANIIQVYTIGEQSGYHYIAQEYVQGRNLAQYLKMKGPPNLVACLHIMRQVAAALKASADAGIVHRDIKPENIMLTRDGKVKVADFGLATLMKREEDVHLTQQGTTMGTPLYMSPEQVTGKEIDHRSDQYSFGVTCFHMLCGRPPYVGKTAMEIAVQHVQADPPEIRSLAPKLPRILALVVHKMMSKNPADRYPTNDAVLKDIRQLARALKDGKDLDTIKLETFADLDASAEFQLKPPEGDSAIVEPPPSGTSSTPAFKPKRKVAHDSPTTTLDSDGPAPDTIDDVKPAIKPRPGLTPVMDEPAPAPKLKRKSRSSTSLKSAAETAGIAAPTATMPPPAARRRVRDLEDDDEYELRKSRLDDEEMDLTPMVDVTFLLLIFFMITASFSTQKAIEIPVPDPDEEGAAAQPTIEEIMQESVLVEIDADNTVTVDYEAISDISELEDLLRTKIEEGKNELMVKAEKEALHETVVFVFDTGTEVGMQKLRQAVLAD